MEKISILVNGSQKEVYGLFYIYNSKYYFIYTEKEVDENDYVILYMTQVGKETVNTPNGPVDTGYMIGVEISDPNEQKIAQESISCIVEDKKNNTKNPKLQYLPISALVNFKILSKKRFRLLKSIIVDNFKLIFDEPINMNNLIENIPTQVNNMVSTSVTPITTLEQPSILVEPIPISQLTVQESQPIAPQKEENVTGIGSSVQNIEPVVEVNLEQMDQSQVNNNVVIDYRTKFFEEEEKNKELQAQIDILTQKLNDIKRVIE